MDYSRKIKVLNLIKNRYPIQHETGDYGLCKAVDYLNKNNVITSEEVFFFYKYLIKHAPKNEYSKVFFRKTGAGYKNPEFFYFWCPTDYQSRIDWLGKHIKRLFELLKLERSESSKIKLFFKKLLIKISY